MSRNGKVQVLANHLTEEQEADALGVVTRTLRAWRQRGEGPPFVKVGKKILYPIDGNAAWLKAKEQLPVRSPRRAA